MAAHWYRLVRLFLTHTSSGCPGGEGDKQTEESIRDGATVPLEADLRRRDFEHFRLYGLYILTAYTTRCLVPVGGRNLLLWRSVPPPTCSDCRVPPANNSPSPSPRLTPPCALPPACIPGGGGSAIPSVHARRRVDGGRKRGLPWA